MQHKRLGFTIVELLIVIVVIAILAAITIVAYNGIQNRAKDTATRNDIAQAVRQLETTKLQAATQSYPSVAAANLKASNGVTITYSPNVTGNQYCVSASNAQGTYMATSLDTTVREGDCRVSQGLFVSALMNGNTTNSGSFGGSFTNNGATLAVGQNGQANGAYQFGADTNLFQAIPTALPLISGSAWVYNDNFNGTPGLLMGINDVGPIHWEISGASWRLRMANIDRGGIVDRGAAQTWSHVAFTYNRSTGELNYYYNNAKVLTVVGNSGTDTYFANGMTIGQSNGNTRQWQGRIDDVRIYNRVLSDSEIGTLYAAGAQ